MSESRQCIVPPAGEWAALDRAVQAFLEHTPLVPPLGLDELEAAARQVMATHDWPAGYRDFLMIGLNNALWRDVVASVPFGRRTLLLPPCLRSSSACGATFDEMGLICAQCGRCCIADLTGEAESLGYAVLVAEGTSIVHQLLENGSIDAVVGVSCMAALERSFPRMIDHAVPGLAVPLLQEGCRDTRVVTDAVRSLIRLHDDSGAQGLPDLAGLRKTVQGWFTAPFLHQLLRTGSNATEHIGIEWLARSGKRWRPFLTAATVMALRRTTPATLDERVAKAAVAVECLHKASLVFDDIQDNDAQRDGAHTLHAEYGTPFALAVGLHLLGLGYRLLTEAAASADEVARLMQIVTHGHGELCLGQGAEMWWHRAPRLLTQQEVVDIFRRKTAPAFEVGLRVGGVLGGASPADHAVLTGFSDALGIAYQIRDDLADFNGKDSASDILAGRLSFLAAVAADHADPRTRECLERTWLTGVPGQGGIARQIIRDLGAESLAQAALARHRDNARSALRPLTNRALKIVLHRVIGEIFK